MIQIWSCHSLVKPTAGTFDFTICCGYLPCHSSVSPSWTLSTFFLHSPLPGLEVAALLNSFQPLKHAPFPLNRCARYINSFKKCIHWTWPCVRHGGHELIGLGGELDRKCEKEEHVKEDSQLWVGQLDGGRRSPWRGGCGRSLWNWTECGEPLSCSRGEVKWAVRVTVLKLRGEVHIL